MKTLLILAFILYAFPSQALVIERVVCLDHVKRTATVHYKVQAPDDLDYLTIEEAREIMCKRIKQNKEGK